MVRKSKGFRAGTRKILGQKPAYRPAITKYIQSFSVGEKVVIEPEPASHSGMPFPRFKGKVGEIIAKRGRSYVVGIFDGKKLKKIVSRPEHLKLVK